MTKNEAKLFFVQYQNYCNIFGEKLVNEAIDTVDVKEFQSTQTVRGEGSYYADKGYPIAGKGTRTFKEYKGEWMKEVNAFGTDYLVPDQYQFAEMKVQAYCLDKAVPCLKNFKYDSYRWSSGEPELYIKCTLADGTTRQLYVPIKALIAADKQIIIDRMTEYFSWYYSRPEKKEYLNKALSALESPEALKLFSIFDEINAGTYAYKPEPEEETPKFTILNVNDFTEFVINSTESDNFDTIIFAVQWDKSISENELKSSDLCGHYGIKPANLFNTTDGEIAIGAIGGGLTWILDKNEYNSDDIKQYLDVSCQNPEQICVYKK